MYLGDPSIYFDLPLGCFELVAAGQTITTRLSAIVCREALRKPKLRGICFILSFIYNCKLANLYVWADVFMFINNITIVTAVVVIGNTITSRNITIQQ